MAELADKGVELEKKEDEEKKKTVDDDDDDDDTDDEYDEIGGDDDSDDEGDFAVSIEHLKNLLKDCVKIYTEDPEVLKRDAASSSSSSSASGEASEKSAKEPVTPGRIVNKISHLLEVAVAQTAPVEETVAPSPAPDSTPKEEEANGTDASVPAESSSSSSSSSATVESKEETKEERRERRRKRREKKRLTMILNPSPIVDTTPTRETISMINEFLSKLEEKKDSMSKPQLHRELVQISEAFSRKRTSRRYIDLNQNSDKESLKQQFKESVLSASPRSSGSVPISRENSESSSSSLGSASPTTSSSYLLGDGPTSPGKDVLRVASNADLSLLLNNFQGRQMNKQQLHEELLKVVQAVKQTNPSEKQNYIPIRSPSISALPVAGDSLSLSADAALSPLSLSGSSSSSSLPSFDPSVSTSIPSIETTPSSPSSSSSPSSDNKDSEL